MDLLSHIQLYQSCVQYQCEDHSAGSSLQILAILGIVVELENKLSALIYFTNHSLKHFVFVYEAE